MAILRQQKKTVKRLKAGLNSTRIYRTISRTWCKQYVVSGAERVVVPYYNNLRTGCTVARCLHCITIHVFYWWIYDSIQISINFLRHHEHTESRQSQLFRSLGSSKMQCCARSSCAPVGSRSLPCSSCKVECQVCKLAYSCCHL